MATSDVFIDYPYELFSYMREIHKPVFHNSNVFLRDLQFSIQDYFEDKQGKTIRDAEAQRIAEEVSRAYERKGIFKKVNPQGYVLNFPELVAGKSGTRGGLSGELPDQMPPPKAAVSAPAPKVAAPAVPKPVAAAVAKATTTPAATGAAPAGAKAPPPWLKK
ncbi:MAG: hypothetical protein WCH46_11065 [bacterium]